MNPVLELFGSTYTRVELLLALIAVGVFLNVLVNAARRPRRA